MAKNNKAEISCGKALTKSFEKLHQFTKESQKAELVAFLEKLFSKENVPTDYANEIITNVKRKSVVSSIIYLGNVVLAGYGMRANG